MHGSLLHGFQVVMKYSMSCVYYLALIIQNHMTFSAVDISIFFFPGDILNFWPLPRVEKGNKYCYKPIDFILIWEHCISVCLMLLIQHQYLGCLHLLACISTNSTGPEVNDHVSLQWPSYEQSHGSNLKPQREQTSWSQAFTTRPSPRWLPTGFFNLLVVNHKWNTENVQF